MKKLENNNETIVQLENTLTINGMQEFMGEEIPVILGGFGTDKKCITDKTVAKIHNMQAKHVRELIVRNEKRFVENIDYIDLIQRVEQNDTLEKSNQTRCLLSELGYAKQSITQAKHIYLLSERGYAKLIKIMDTDKAWEIHDRLMDEYFRLREEIKLTREQRLAYALVDAQAIITEQQQQIKELSQFHQDLISTEGLRSIEEVAKVLSEGQLGRNQLFSFLRDCKILYYKNGINLPYQRYIKQGLFKVRESLGKNGQYYPTTYATTKGEEYIRNLMYKQGLLISTFIITSQKGINNYE